LLRDRPLICLRHRQVGIPSRRWCRVYYVVFTSVHGFENMAPKKTRKPSSTSATSGPKSPVTLRLGDLEAEVEVRAAGAPLGSIVRRDLARYYRLLKDYDIRFGVDEADAIVHALRGFNEGAYQYIWAAVDELLSGRDAVMEELHVRNRFWRVNREDLIVMLRLHMGDQGRRMAIVDAVERYWHILKAAGVDPPIGLVRLPEGHDAVTEPQIDALVDVGLTSPGYAKRYRKERDEPSRSNSRQPQQSSAAAEYVRDAQDSAAKRIRKFARPGDV
jgi:hypothetical protein